MTMFDLTGKLALVTGSSRGLGLALAQGLAQHGATVVVHGRDQHALTRASNAVGHALTEASSAVGHALTEARSAEAERIPADPPAPAEPAPTVSFDVTDPSAVEQGIDHLIQTHGVPDILVNNAGIQRRAPFNEFAPEDWDAVIAGNLSSAFYVSRQVTPGMAERGSGKVINIGSVMTQLARQTIVPYSASKGGVAMLTKGMAADLARFNIQVNAISPGYFKTEMNTALVADQEFSSWISSRTPSQRWGVPEELVGTLVYLASPASSYVNGQNIFVDGGMTAIV